MDTKLQEYAKLLIEVGLNVQKGQTLIISSPVECASFARLCADAAYDAGCREVIMNWSDDYLSRQKFLRADASVFDDTPEWREKFFTSYAEMGAAYLAIAASDPETLKGVDPDRLVRSQKSGSVLRKTFDRLQMSNGFPWCIASVPIPSWAATVFPELPEDQAMEKLWDAIFETVRIKGDNTAVAAQMVAQSGRKDVAALSSRACAELYGLDCLRSSVQDKGNNRTRFICISRNLEIYPGSDKTSIMMVLNHKPGALYKVLARLYTLGINVTKLESRPIPDREFEFMFYFDLETSIYSEEFVQLMCELDEMCEEFKYLGSYTEVV